MKLLQKIGERLHGQADTEAAANGLEVTELQAGLVRRYRDPRFNDLAARQAAREKKANDGTHAAASR